MDECVCAAWADSRPLWIKHHRSCPQYDAARDGTELIRSLVRGMESWSADEDGIHPDAWEAYKAGKFAIGEIPKEQ